jgi:alkylation response protein AidB-like acyl-CoA dehydrogenase
MVVAKSADVSAEVEALVARARELRQEFARTSAEVDASGEDPAENMRLIWEAGLNRINVPREYGGLSTGEMTWGFAALIEILTELCAGESSTGMCWAVQTLVTREIFAPDATLPASTRRRLAHEILNEGVRFVASNAEAGGRGEYNVKTAGRPVPGGIVVSGTKLFNTNSGGARYANIGISLEGDRHHALVPLDAPGVRLHHDWDNMGQRATISQAITYEDVFVPEEWHFGAHPPHIIGAGLYLLHSTILLGAGLGGFDALLEHTRMLNKSITPTAADALGDPMVRWHIGGFSAKLAAARALQREAARMVEEYDGPDEGVPPIQVHAVRAKLACIDAALTVTSELHNLTGARSTANKYRLDRFWRNARTFSVHDSTDVKRIWVGGWDLAGEAPPNVMAHPKPETPARIEEVNEEGF